MRERNEDGRLELTRAVNEYMQSRMPGCLVESLDFRLWLMDVECSIKERAIAGEEYKVLYLGDKKITKWRDEAARQLGDLSPRAIGLTVLKRASKARIDSRELPQEDVSTEEFIHELETHPRNRGCCC